ncbi:MAG: (2Fe-2S)-binding protein [Spirochaetota bacterium]
MSDSMLTINGRPVPVSQNELELSLLDYLREQRLLHGVKNGCNTGLCGSCTVAMDDKAVRSCRIKVSAAIGTSIITIEGMEYRDGTLHPLQQAFLDAGAVQCGFCTPGMIMSSYVLLRKTPDPSREAIRKALKGNLCRCTGYQHIIDAVELAASYIRERNLSTEAGSLL